MSIVSDPKGRGITVTIRYGKGYEETWAVFHGLAGEVRDDIMTYFGMDPDQATGLTLSDLVINATGVAHAVGNVAGILGATVIASAPGATAAQPQPASSPATDAWATAANQPDMPTQPAANPLLRLIAQVPDVPALKRLWAENQAAFADPVVMTAWKARGKALNATAQ